MTPKGTPAARNLTIAVATAALAGSGAAMAADGAIEQAEADTVMRGVIAGSVDPGALVRAGTVSSAHMPAIDKVLREVKRANAGAGG
jgi:hypothetical protein